MLPWRTAAGSAVGARLLRRSSGAVAIWCRWRSTTLLPQFTALPRISRGMLLPRYPLQHAFASTAAADSELSAQYQKKSQREHILLRPEPYIGSVETVRDSNAWLVDEATHKLYQTKKPLEYVPALVHLFDEILVNACDNQYRHLEEGDTLGIGSNSKTTKKIAGKSVTKGKRKKGEKPMKELRVTINASENLISVENDGPGVPVILHDKEKVYVPEMVFGHLLTSSNYDDSVDRLTGGRHGFGAKLTNIFSTEFHVEVIDATRKLRYTQTFRDNMNTIEAPVVEKVKGSRLSNRIKISFRADLPRFGMKKMSASTVALLKKRVYDVAAAVGESKVAVYLNDELVPCSGWEAYVSMLDNKDGDMLFHSGAQYWKVAVGVRDLKTQSNSAMSGDVAHVSFVNGIATPRGGTHVNVVANQVARYVLDYVKRTKKGLSLTQNQIKSNLFIFVSCLVVNPSFDGQTKDCLITPAQSFGGNRKLPESFLLKLVRSTSLVDQLVHLHETKLSKQFISKTNRAASRRSSKMFHIPKLDDANWAGTAKSRSCSLILTEGDSAKALAVAGLSVVGRDKYGVFPLRGKLLNVRGATKQQMLDNVEISNVIEILGLRHGIDYSKQENREHLRYGRVILMTDQDHDGTHIKGLFVNFLSFLWPSLLQANDFLDTFITPLIKVTKQGAKKSTPPLLFYSIPEYEQWKQTIRASSSSSSAFSAKYYKGLGTNTAAEARNYFSDLPTHLKRFVYQDAQDDELIDMAFAK